MLISFQCEQCGTRYKVDETRAGQSGKCRKCGSDLRVPVPPPPIERSPSGTAILRHAEREKPFELATGDEETIDAISDHIERHIGPAPMVFHELVSDLVHIDVHHVPPDADRDFHTLITSGMSDRPMTVPEGAEAYRFAELVLCLPEEWPVTMEAFKDDRNYWPVRLLKELARLPHEYDTWLGVGHTVPNGGDQPTAYAKNTRLTCALIVPAVPFGRDFRELEMPDGRIINFYVVWPLLPEEVAFKMKHGYDKLVNRMLDAGVTDIIDVDRRSGLRRRWWWPFGD